MLVFSVPSTCVITSYLLKRDISLDYYNNSAGVCEVVYLPYIEGNVKMYSEILIPDEDDKYKLPSFCCTGSLKVYHNIRTFSLVSPLDREWTCVSVSDKTAFWHLFQIALVLH